MNNSSRNIIRRLLKTAEIDVDGSEPWDIRIKDDRFYERVFHERDLGLGESYMEGWWECDALDECISRILKAGLDKKVKGNTKILLLALRSRLFNRQRGARAFEVGRRHYDLGNDLYETMLDKRMNYTCAYWRDAKNLDEAQEAKLDLICRKIGLEPGMSVLDLGCGWGAFAKFAAERYGTRVLGVTVSKEQVELGTRICEGLPVELRLMDYRDVEGIFDRVISIGIMEHVGPKNHRTYMKVIDRCLKEDGLSFIHTIGSNESVRNTNAWSERYIFPNSILPSISQLSKAMEGIFTIEDLHNIGPHYDPTLMAWWENFDRAWPRLKDTYGDRFYRMWRFYLLSSAGAFRARHNQLWQIVLNRPGKKQPACRYQ